MNNVFFFQTQQIPDSSSIFDQLKNQQIFFSYFQVDQKYYLSFYSQKSIDINFFYKSVDVIQELDSKQRKIRSLRGFFLYASKVMETGTNYEILETNLQPFFWIKVKNVIRQNKKAALQEFLFGKDKDNKLSNHDLHLTMKDAIAKIQNQIDSIAEQSLKLQNRINDLETTLTNSKYSLSSTLKAPDDTKTIQQSDYTLKTDIGSYSLENDSQIDSEVREADKLDSNMLSEASKSRLKMAKPSEEYKSTLCFANRP